MASWDLSFYAEKLQQHKYEISQEILRPYFPEDKVLSGLFYTVSRLFGLKIVEQKDFDRWHNDVRFFDIFDETDEHRGSFYLDLYAAQVNVVVLGWMIAVCAVKPPMDCKSLWLI